MVWALGRYFTVTTVDSTWEVVNDVITLTAGFAREWRSYATSAGSLANDDDFVESDSEGDEVGVDGDGYVDVNVAGDDAELRAGVRLDVDGEEDDRNSDVASRDVRDKGKHKESKTWAWIWSATTTPAANKSEELLNWPIASRWPSLRAQPSPRLPLWPATRPLSGLQPHHSPGSVRIHEHPPS